ncbi:MAG: amidase [Solirubrobacterales bacterium]
MDSSELLAAGIFRQAELLAAGEISSRELTEASLELIGRLEPQLNAFRIVLGERARERADDADRRLAAGERAPLLGVPVAVKDNVDVAGELTTHGTRAFTKTATQDSEHARRLREAGAVLVGKTNLPELAICGFTETEAWGITRNPWDTTRSTGGSSGGSGAAVAAAMVGAASASDGAGSIRIPAANCGLFGLKPQRGRVSLMPDPEHWLGMSQAGCLTRRVIDTALWLDVAAGQAEGDAETPPSPGSFLDAARRAPGKLRIAVSTTPVRAAAPPILDDQVPAALEATADVMRGLGHDVVERAPDYGSIGNGIVPRYLRGVLEDYERVPHPERLEPRTRGFARLGRMIPDRLLHSALRAETSHATRINAIFDDVDVVMTPVTGEPAIEIGRWAGKGALRTLLGMSRTYPYTPVWNYTGQPAASIPAPVAEGELPIGAMLIAPPNREDVLLSLAAQFEAETAWPDRLPDLAR